MRTAFNYRIYLTNGQRRILERQLEECRFVYNETLVGRSTWAALRSIWRTRVGR